MLPGTWPPPPEPLDSRDVRLLRDVELSDLEIWKSHLQSKPGTEFVEETGFYLHNYPLPVRPLNELRVTGAVADIAALLRRASEFFAGISSVWRVVLSQEQLVEWEGPLRAAGLEREPDHPVLVLPTDGLSPLPPCPGLEIRRVGDSEEMHEFQRTFNRVSENLEDDFWENSRFLENPNLDFFVGSLDGEPCATGIGQTEHGLTGIWGIVTSPLFRGRGAGSAVTKAVVEAGAARGATAAHLWASEMGFPVYRRLGFRHVENRVVFSRPSRGT